MDPRLFVLLAWSGLLLIFCVGCNGKRSWECELLSFSISSSDESKLNVSGRAERVGRSERTITAVLDWKFDADESTMVLMQLYCCQSGREEDFILLPYQVPPMSFYIGLEKHYQELLYKNYGYCSNLPDAEANIIRPWPKIKYEFHDCSPNGNGFPDILPLGYYKIVFQVVGEVEMNIILIFKLSPKLI